MKHVFLSAAVAMAAAQASGQSLSVDDIRAQIAAEQSQPNPYEELLADPDPFVARRAMQIMIESGDEVLRRIAIDFGVNSPDPEFRHLALLAWFQSNPRMEIVFENNGSPADQYREVARWRGSEPDSQGRFIWITQITGYNAEATCFMSGRDCLFRHTPNGAWINQANVWQEIAINNQGELAGNIVKRSTGGWSANVRFRVPVP
jgi:hypothetical protein